MLRPLFCALQVSHVGPESPAISPVKQIGQLLLALAPKISVTWMVPLEHVCCNTVVHFA